MDFRVFDEKEVQIRSYLPSDRQSVRDLCCDTGFLGTKIDPVFEDRELFADFLTDYYLSQETDSAFVLTENGVVKGYLLGSRFPLRHQLYSLFKNVIYAGKVIRRYTRYNHESRRFIHWMISKAWQEVPAAPRRVGHFHANLLPDVKSIAAFRRLLETYLKFLSDQGVKRIYGQMVTFDGRRGFKLFERYGFKVLNQSEITKYRRFTNQSVYLCTVIKNLEQEKEQLLIPLRDCSRSKD
ncbi:MAG: GNAT family acetyltransferase [Verrucomicrobia bacterium]|nr:GNAT family acetyltransferase [Verrucomicrobiota bacterium]MBV9673170.1 GNAT family acetyltransferase [Verrucomicrobiota bacterium]